MDSIFIDIYPLPNSLVPFRVLFELLLFGLAKSIMPYKERSITYYSMINRIKYAIDLVFFSDICIRDLACRCFCLHRVTLDKYLEFRAHEDYRNILLNLEKEYSNVFMRFPKSLLAEMVELIQLMKKDKKEFVNRYDKLIESCSEIPIYALTARYWKSLYIFAFSNGLFRLGKIFRQNALKICLGFKAPRKQFVSAKAHAELGNYDIAINRIKKHKRLLVLLHSSERYRKDVKQFEILMYILTGAYVSEAKDEYTEYLKNYDLVICGPAPTNEIKQKTSREVVIRIGYTGLENLPINEKGYSADITYYTKTKEKDIDAEQLIRNEEVHYVVIKDGSETSESNSPRIIYIDEFYNVFFSGHPNMIPVVLIDVLTRTSPKTVSVEQTSLFLGEVYQEGYINKRHDELWWDSFALHDSISQYVFLEHLYKRNIIIPDKTLLEILQLGCEQYLVAMEKQYVTSILPCSVSYYNNRLHGIYECGIGFDRV